MVSDKRTKRLSSLLAGVKHKLAGNITSLIDDIEISQITCDSRSVEPGGMFVALCGVHFDGHQFVEAAIRSGSSVVLCERETLTEKSQLGKECLFILVNDSALAYAEIAANFFNRPAEKLKCIGVTGTNGKTTVTYLVEQVLMACGKSVGVIGTVNNRYTAENGELIILPTRFTTPEAFILQQVLWEMTNSGIEYLIMEVSSHALKQARVGTLTFEVAAFTNLTRDHLDYHPDMEDYFLCKSLLFTKYLRAGGTAVVPDGSGRSEEGVDWDVKLNDLLMQSGIHRLSWGTEAESDLQLVGFTQDLNGLSMTLAYDGDSLHMNSPLTGRFNLENVLSATGICFALGLTATEIAEAMTSAAGSPGRLERVDIDDVWPAEHPVTFVDYAHTPDALWKVLATVAELPHRDLICIFGCGGDRDRGKRPKMAEVAATFADVVIVTDDNPRTEDPASIIADVIAGFDAGTAVYDSSWLLSRKVGDRGVVVVPQRDHAIEAAVGCGKAGDVVLVAGKGHEPYQITSEGKKFFDDRLEVAKQLFAWRVNLVAEAVGAKIAGEISSELRLGSVITDSRQVAKNSIFVALKGENHDAHDFARQAVANGASCLVVEREVELADTEGDVVQLVVPDSLTALGDLAAFRRRAVAARYGQPFIGLTGSCGKTTVKEMVAAILERMWPVGEFNPPDCVLKTKGNFNNLIGMPLSLLPLGPLHRAAVLEMGMNQPGELRRLAEIADPDIACILNIHGAHLAGLSNIEGVAKAKEELFQATRSDATLVVNLDDPLVVEISSRYSQAKLTYSVKPPEGPHQPEVWATKIGQSPEGLLSFVLHHGGQKADVHMYTAGLHNVANGVAAAAITLAAGADLTTVAAGLADFRPPDKRLQIITAPSGALLINDSYNANPASMAAGLQTLHGLDRERKTAIIGDMLELGESSKQAHADIGRLAAELGLDQIITIGEFCRDVERGALEGGMAAGKITAFTEKEDGHQWLRRQLAANMFGLQDAILIKASRGCRFETMVDIFINSD